MVVEGMVASLVGSGEKGVGFKVMCRDLGDTFKVFIPADRVKGEASLNMGDIVKVEFNKFFSSKDEVRMDIKSITLNNGKKSI